MDNPFHKDPSLINLNYEKHDIRILDRLFARGELVRKDYEKHVKTLEDEKANSEISSLKLQEEDLEETDSSAK